MLEIKTGSATLKIWNINEEKDFQISDNGHTLTWIENYKLEQSTICLNHTIETDQQFTIVKLWSRKELIEYYS